MSHAAEAHRDHERHRAEWEAFAESIRCACGKPAAVVIVEAEDGWCEWHSAEALHEQMTCHRERW